MHSSSTVLGRLFNESPELTFFFGSEKILLCSNNMQYGRVLLILDGLGVPMDAFLLLIAKCSNQVCISLK
jgi:hypothetical protein